MSNRICKEEQIKLIMDCRRSGLSDYQWCKKNGINPGNFYNWVSKLRKKGYTFPESESKSNEKPNIQEVVKLDICFKASSDSNLLIEQNASFSTSDSLIQPAAELLI